MQQSNLSWLQPQHLFDKLSGHAGAKQHNSDQDVQQVLDLRHALGTFVKASLDAFVPLGADSLVNA